MFSYCGTLTSLNLSNFNTSEVVDFSGLFKGNKNLQSIDISSLYTDKMNSYKEMFLELPKNGIITFNMNTHFMILEQIPEEWEKIKVYR